MSKDTEYLQRHGWRWVGSELRVCKKTPLYKKVGIEGTYSAEEAMIRQRRGDSPVKLKKVRRQPL